MTYTPQYPRSTPRHRREEILTCPQTGGKVCGYVCLRTCEHAEEQGEEALYFTCDLLDREGAGDHATASQAR